MIQSRISRINFMLLVLAVLSIFAFVATKAYFTTSKVSQNNIFTSGTIDINLSQASDLVFNGWMPGEEHEIKFDVQNIGTLPIYFKGYYQGQWENEQLDNHMVEIVSVERYLDSEWQKLSSGLSYSGDEFYFAVNGNENSLDQLMPQEESTLRLVVKLSESVTDEYQNQIFNSNLHLAAKQVVNGTSWPMMY